MRWGRIVPSLILFLLFVFPWAFAQSPAPRLELFLEGGSSFSNSGSLTETNYDILTNLPCPTSGCVAYSVRMIGSFPETIRPAAGARCRFTRRNAVEAGYSYSLYHSVTQQVGQSALAGYNRDDLVSFNYVRYLSAKARVQPFLTVGLGINRFSGPSNAPAVVHGYMNADNGWQLAGNYGGGADLVLKQHFALRMELRDYVTGQPTAGIASITPFVTVTRPGTSHNVVPSLGVVFRFK